MPVRPPRRHHRDLDVIDVFVEFLEFNFHLYPVARSPRSAVVRVDGPPLPLY
jgi:hypothetical protein